MECARTRAGDRAVGLSARAVPLLVGAWLLGRGLGLYAACECEGAHRAAGKPTIACLQQLREFCVSAREVRRSREVLCAESFDSPATARRSRCSRNPE